MSKLTLSSHSSNKSFNAPLMKISGKRCPHWPRHRRHLRQSSIRPPLTRHPSRSPHNEAVDRLTTISTPRIPQEIDGCVYQNTRGFHEKYFERRSWSAVEKIVRARCKPADNGQSLDGVPKSAITERLFFQAQSFRRTRGTYDISHSIPLAGSDWGHQPDLFLIPSGLPLGNFPCQRPRHRLVEG